MLQKIVSLSVLLLFMLGANAKTISTQSIPGASGWDIASVTLTELPEVVPPVPLVASDCSTLNMVQPNGFTDIDWNSILTIGEKVWQIIEAGKPVVTVNTPVVSALPRGLKCWSELANWQVPAVKSYEVSYVNGFGFEVVKFRFRLQYTFGGGRPAAEGKGSVGQYIANATVMPAEINVSWLYNFDAGIEVGDAINRGTLDAPLAGLEMNLKWTVKTVVKESQNSFHFYVQGDGFTSSQN